LKKILSLIFAAVLIPLAPANAASMKITKSLVELNYTKSDQISDVLLTPVSIVLVGTTESATSPWLGGTLTGLSDGFITSYSSIGAPMWNLRLPGLTDEIATNAAIDADGSIWVVGASSSQVVPTPTPSPTRVLNPDNVVIDPTQPAITPLNRIKLWQVSSTGNLLNSYEYVSQNIITPRKILISASNLIIVGNLYEKSATSGFYLSTTKTGVFSPIIKIGSKSTQINDAILNADGSLTAVGASGESLLKVKPISKLDALTIRISGLGVLQQVARATLKNTTRSWNSIDAGLLQAGQVLYSNKQEAAVTKFSALNKPVWNTRYPSRSSALASVSKNTWATFVSSGAIKGVPAWKPKTVSSVLLELGKKGEVISAHTLSAPAVAIASNNEIGTVVITDSGVSFGLVVVN
jgi:hypothetical protein